MSTVIELLRRRIAGRSLSPEPLPEAVILDLLEAARLTPSCFNKQPWRFVFMESEQARRKGFPVLSSGNQPWAGRAPLLILGYSRADNDCQLKDGRAYHQFDLGMAAMNLMLCATEHGLAARPMAGFDPDAARKIFGLDPADQPLVMIAVGRPSADESHLAEHYRGLDQKPRERKPAAEIVRRW
jgi:nitroreductase